MVESAAGLFAIAQEEAGKLMAAGADAVVLTGSVARGLATGFSDIDLIVLGNGPRYRLERQAGVLISISWRTAEQVRASFQDVREVMTTVPGWRDGMLLADPRALARELQEEARCWKWEDLGPRTDLWVAEEVTGLAEEVQKLCAALEYDHVWDALIQRNVLATHLPLIMAVHHRLLLGTEGGLWDAVAAVSGEPWRAAQAAALAEQGEDRRTSTAAALRLYLQACESVSSLFDEVQRAVVEGACEFARRLGST